MTVREIVVVARRNRATLEHIYLVLALIEVGAYQTPIFDGVEGEDLIVALLTLIRIRQPEFYEKYLDNYTRDDFVGFLSTCPELSFKIEDLKRILGGIKTKGEEHYEFARIDGLDKKDAGHESSPGAGPQGSQDQPA